MLIGNDFVFWNPEEDDDAIEVRNLPEDFDQLSEEYMYLIGDHVYSYIGTFPNAVILRDSYPEGGVFGTPEGRTKLMFYDYTDEEIKKAYSSKYIIPKSLFEKMDDIDNIVDTASDSISSYLEDLKLGNNISLSAKQRKYQGGTPYVPTFTTSDDPLERLLKITVTSMRIISAESRNLMENDYEFDNLVSTFEGMTKHVSTDKVLEWCRFLKLDWEFSVYPIEHHDWELDDEVLVTNEYMEWMDIDPLEYKSVFKTPLVENEDPLKRLIKLSLGKMNCPTKFYRDRGDTPYVINNMKSALKNTRQKMKMDYFMKWCNLLGLGFGFQFTRPDGIWYRSVGYDVSTNDPDDYAMRVVSEVTREED